MSIRHAGRDRRRHDGRRHCGTGRVGRRSGDSARRPGDGHRRRPQLGRAGRGRASEESQAGGVHGLPTAPRSSRSATPTDDLGASRALRPRDRSDHRTARAQAGAVRAAREAASRAHDRRIEHVEHSDAHARSTESRADLPIALRRHALLQPAAISASARDHSTPRHRAGRSTRSASSATASSERASSSPTTSPASSPTGSACSGWCSRFARWKSTVSRSTRSTCSPACWPAARSRRPSARPISRRHRRHRARHGRVERRHRRGLRAVTLGARPREGGAFRRKSGAGFYRRVGKEIQTLDWKTGEYGPQSKPESAELSRIGALPLADRFAAIRDWGASKDDHYGAFVREYCCGSRTTYCARGPSSRETFSRSMTRWSGATRGRPGRSRKWISSASIFWPRDSSSYRWTFPSFCAGPGADWILQRERREGPGFQGWLRADRTSGGS